ncbi:MAG: GspE/PulE family protein, partial [Deltaproteobacteria bacterium]|nr:GspE/PulE family protein [Deltaproteobacteria bacterium]
MKLGDLLLKEGKISQEHLEVALREQRRTKEHLGKVLNRLGFVTQADVCFTLASQAGVKCVNLRTYNIDPAALKLIPYEFALKNKILPLSLRNGQLQVAVANPLDVVTLDEVRRITKHQVEPVAAPEDEISKTLDDLYEKDLDRREGRSENFEVFLEETIRRAGTLGIRERVEELADVGPIIELVDRIVIQAVKSEATDIHIEPDENTIRIRFRIDGNLHQFSSLPKNLQSAVTTRIKIMSNLNISENRIPQDGRADFPMEERKIDLRISVFPCVFGENIAIRILDKERLTLGLERLGFSPQTLSLYKQIIPTQNGIILVTGPTGSGKTTTLYSTLSQLNSREKNIITIEDPVEYLLSMIQQSQINPKAGLTFASGLRSMLRQDPDIILVGEIRDAETMEMAIRAALTGHLVFSTLHTNDAAGAIPRLLDMGLEPFLLASSLIAVLSQRLCRIICSYCKEIARVDQTLLSTVGWDGKEVSLFRGRGCNKCNQTGYRGRTGIFELLLVSPKIQKLIMERKDSKVIK